jgi:7,8-dihydropterin-6-yl-methyl-4-(beta-D-ribofuranosyl)aminobenzene 5'-phosphate synthase
MRELGVEKVGVTHCSGVMAIHQFAMEYGEDFVPLGVGRVLTFPAPR